MIRLFHHENDGNREDAKREPGTKIYGAKWGGMLGSKTYPSNTCGQILYVCNPNKIVNQEIIDKSQRQSIKHYNPEAKELNTSIETKNSKETINLRASLAEEANKYCAAHGDLIVRKIEEIQQIAEDLVNKNKPKRGRLNEI